MKFSITDHTKFNLLEDYIKNVHEEHEKIRKVDEGGYYGEYVVVWLKTVNKSKFIHQT